MLDRMELGVHFPDYTLPGEPATIAPTLAAAARAAEDTGYALFTVMDHWFQMESFRTAEDPMLEGYTSLGFVAALTRRIELGLLVTGVTYRHPGLLAKIVTTLDVLSGGRAVLGIGAAWYEREHLGLGVPYPPVAERFERLEETLQICRQMWSDDDGPFDGRHYQLAETLCRPQPIAGRTRRSSSAGVASARRCDSWPSTATPATCSRAASTRWPTSSTCSPGIATTSGATRPRSRSRCSPRSAPSDDPDAFLADMVGYARLGVSRVSIMPTGDDPVGVISTLGEQLVPRLAAARA